MATDQQRADQFLALWKTSMHWTFNSMQDAVTTWQTRGINGLCRCTAGAVSLLSGEVAKNSEFHAMLQQQALAA